MVPIYYLAPTWTFVRLQPPEQQLCFVKAPTLDLGALTPRTPILPVLRRQPQGLQPSAVKACLIVILCSQNSSLLNSVCLHLHCSVHATTSMATNIHMKKSLQLFILSTQSLQNLSHDDIK